MTRDERRHRLRNPIGNGAAELSNADVSVARTTLRGLIVSLTGFGAGLALESVFKDWKRKTGGGWSRDSQLWLYRRSD